MKKKRTVHKLKVNQGDVVLVGIKLPVQTPFTTTTFDMVRIASWLSKASDASGVNLVLVPYLDSIKAVERKPEYRIEGDAGTRKIDTSGLEVEED